MATQAPYFSDFDWSFIAHPKTGDITILTDDLAVKRALKNVVFTKFSERRFYSNKGCGINYLLFEPIDIITARMIDTTIRTAVSNFEPRIIIHDISISTDSEETGIYITITYQIINSITIDTTTIFLERAR
jgi:uncharacterized protein